MKNEYEIAAPIRSRRQGAAASRDDYLRSAMVVAPTSEKASDLDRARARLGQLLAWDAAVWVEVYGDRSEAQRWIYYIRQAGRWMEQQVSISCQMQEDDRRWILKAVVVNS